MKKIIRYTYKLLLKPILFLMDPEKVHNAFLKIGQTLGNHKPTRSLTKSLFDYQSPRLTQTLCGLTFKNPVGLAAGFDKNGEIVDILPEVGFAFGEIGTVTYKPYGGNPQPRLYRLKKSKALIVNYGLKNDGVHKVIERLRKRKAKNFPLAVSVGKTNCKSTSTTETAIEDYCACMSAVVKADVADFYTINISCPNTHGGEPFTTKEKLTKLLENFSKIKIKKPLFLKMPTNLPWEKFAELLALAKAYKVDGVIIGNLNKDRNNKDLKEKIPDNISGSISGKPTEKTTNMLIKKSYSAYGKDLLIIGTGGIFSAEDAYEKIQLGASLVQLITGMIYEGPQLIGEINQGLVKLLQRDGYQNITQAIGSKNQPR